MNISADQHQALTNYSRYNLVHVCMYVCMKACMNACMNARCLYLVFLLPILRMAYSMYITRLSTYDYTIECMYVYVCMTILLL